MGRRQLGRMRGQVGCLKGSLKACTLSKSSLITSTKVFLAVFLASLPGLSLRQQSVAPACAAA